MTRVESWIRLGVGFVYMGLSFVVHATVLVLLMPFRGVRIRSCNVYGWITGRVVTWLSGSPITVLGREHLDPGRPAIYLANHASILDIFTGIMLGPMGVVGVAKKEIVYTPFFGQLYWLSGHLLIDRGRSDRARAAMERLQDTVNHHGLSIWMFPEGTRSRDGRLLPLKKGFVHLAIGTGLPVVPVVHRGAHKAWEKGTTRLTGSPIEIEVLPAIDTSDWADRSTDEIVEEVHAVFAAHLHEDQQPLPV